MANKNPVITKEFYENQFKAKAPKYGEKLGKKVWSVRLPEDVEKKLESLPREQRIQILRKAITDSVRELD